MKVTAGLVLAGVLLFGASFNDPFHFDDALITNDSNVTNSARWGHFLNPLHLRQLTFFTFYLNHLVDGTNPAGYHVVNVAIHIANAVLLFVLLKRYVESWVAIAAAAIFLVHPIQTQAVLYVYERSTLLACLFSLLGLIALAERRHWWAAGMFFLAFKSKESALAVPLLVALLPGLPSPGPFLSPTGRSLKNGARVRAGVLTILLAAVALTLLVDEKTVGFGASISPLRYLLTETRVAFTYLRLLFFPYPQSLEYDFHNAGGFLTATGIVLILLIGWLLRRRVEGLCILAFFILLAPTSSIIPSADAAFEHRLYLPMLAFSLLAAHLISKIARRTWIAGALLIILGTLTIRREIVWSSDIALWEDTARHAPGKARVWFNLGGAYLNSDLVKARAALIRAIDLQPHFPEALYDLGVIEQGKNNWRVALAYYERAIAQEADYWPAWNNIGNTLFAMGERPRALEYFERTLRLNPDYWPAQYNIAIVHFMGGRYTDAVPKLRTVLDWRPDFREARYLLAMSLTRAGDRSLADVEWKKLGEGNAAESRYTPTMILAPNRP
jgi:tetratricopeptide (TPR) repeat protein